VKTRLVVARKGGRYPRSRWFATEKTWGLDGSQVCSWVSQLQKPVGGMWSEGHQRIAGQTLRSSAPSGCERMSEAGLTVAKPGYQWRLVGQRSSENADGDLRDLSVEDASSSRKLPH
jgi:hypothetical protein